MFILKIQNIEDVINNVFVCATFCITLLLRKSKCFYKNQSENRSAFSHGRVV